MDIAVLRDIPEAQLKELIEAAQTEQKRRGEAAPVNPDAYTHSTGALRSERIKPRFDLIPYMPLRRLALRYTLGAEKYGEYNWQKGLPFDDTFNHVINHLYQLRERYYSYLRQGGPHPNDFDDDLSAAAWGCFALMFFFSRGDYSLAPAYATGKAEAQQTRPYQPPPSTGRQYNQERGSTVVPPEKR